MELPNRHLAYIAPEKITHYLLNVNHPTGGGKARAFRGRGYDESNVSVFIRNLLAVAHTGLVSDVTQFPNGTHYVIYGEIQPPYGSPMLVKTIWRIDAGREAPRLISAYPRQTMN